MATRNLVALKVKVGIDPITGYAQYPNFNLISSAVRKDMDWSKYLDVHGGGMHYDKTCGHKEESVESPFGEQICCMCVPEDFATAALSLFPIIVTEQSEVEFETFYNTKAHAHEPDESIDEKTLNGLSAQRALKTALAQDTTVLDAKIAKALDPDDKEAGVKKNVKKTWTDAKTAEGISLVATAK